MSTLTLLGFTLGGASAALVCARIAHAQVDARSGVELDWRAASGCPARERVLADVAQMVTTTDRTVRARAVVTQRPAPSGAVAYALELFIDGGVRRLEADRCDALAEAAAFILALAVDPNAKPLPPKRATAPEAADAGVASPRSSSDAGDDAAAQARAGIETGPPKRAEEIAPAPVVEAPRPPRAFVAAGVGGAFGLMPKPALAPFVIVGARVVPSIKLSLAGSWFFEQTTEGTIGAKVSGGSIGPRVTWAALARDEIEIGLTGGALVHLFDASAFGATSSGAGAARWGGAVAGVEAIWLLDARLALRAEAFADLAFASPEFVIDNVGAVHRPAVLSACAVLGAEARFF